MTLNTYSLMFTVPCHAPSWHLHLYRCAGRHNITDW